MAIKLKPLNNQVMIITGASSGIGLATAKAAAKKGVKLVLVARNEEALQKTVQELTSLGAQAIYVAADVGNQNEIQQIAQKAVEQFGRIDTWVNNAANSIYGRLEEVSDEDSRRMFETNFWGVVYGSLTAVEYLKKQGGALINVGSVASDIGFPLQGMYAASKHAVKGFTDSLRIELQDENAPVSVTLIKPAGINTPFPQHAKKYTDKETKLPPPVYEPEEVAYGILHAATHPERDVYVGGGGKFMSSFNKMAPRTMDYMNEKVMIKQQLRKESVRDREGALYGPSGKYQVRGEQPGYVMKKSLYTRASTHPVLTGAVLAALGAAAFTWLSSSAARQGANT